MPTWSVRWIRRALLALLAALLPAAAHSQQLVTGRVTDAETGQPIIGARVVLVDSQVGVLSDFNGRFSRPVPPDFDRTGNPKVRVTSVGHEGELVLAHRTSSTDFLVRRLDLRLRRYEPPIRCGRVALYSEPRVVFPEPGGRFRLHVPVGLPAPALLLLALTSGGAVSGLLLALGVLEREEERRVQRQASGR